MVGPKKARSKSPFSPDGPLGVLFGPAKPLVIAALLAGGLLVAWYAVWQRVRQRVLASDDYLVTAEKVEITPLPPWIHGDIRGEVFRSASVDGSLSIMDDGLAERVRNAFSLHPWVAKVCSVRKLPQARVRVELEYRQPVCMVDVGAGLLPVDVSGVLLPVEDFSPVEASRYPRLLGIDTAPVGPPGESWGDTRVVGGAEIAGALRNLWDPWKLWQIVASPSGIDNEASYTILTRGGSRIRWGLAPGSKVPGEPSATEKIARLGQYVLQYGTLEGRDAPQELDVHKLPPTPATQ